MNNSSNLYFGFYEMIRILVPGFYFASLSLFVFYYLFSSYLVLSVGNFHSIILFLFIMIVAGLTMYSKETPKRRRAFAENQPSSYLQELSRRHPSNHPLNEADARKLYFYILNHFMPPAFHEKVFFFGTVYHVMTQIRRNSFWFALISIIILAINISRGVSYEDQLGMIIFGMLVLFIYFLNVKYNKADRKMQENYQDQIFWLQMNEELIVGLFDKYNGIKKTNLV